jgi:hypothetical protein
MDAPGCIEEALNSSVRAELSRITGLAGFLQAGLKQAFIASK